MTVLKLPDYQRTVFMGILFLVLIFLTIVPYVSQMIFLCGKHENAQREIILL